MLLTYFTLPGIRLEGRSLHWPKSIFEELDVGLKLNYQGRAHPTSYNRDELPARGRGEEFSGVCTVIQVMQGCRFLFPFKNSNE